MQIEEHDISDVGRLLLEVIDDKPGIHFRALERAANLNSAGQLRHHVDRLLRNRLIVEYEEGGYKRFFRSGHHDPQLLPRIARFARPVPRRIAKLLLVRPLSRTELRRRLGCADSTLGYHLTRMTLLGDVLKHRRCNSCHYSLADPEGVRAALDALEGNGEQEENGGGAAGIATRPHTRSEAPPEQRPYVVPTSAADPVPHVGRSRPVAHARAPGDRVPHASSVRSRFQSREDAQRPEAEPAPDAAPRYDHGHGRAPTRAAPLHGEVPRRSESSSGLDMDDAETRHLYGERPRWGRRGSNSEATSYASA